MNRILFLISVFFATIGNALLGRSLAINGALVPLETSRGTATLQATAVIAFKNAVVVRGATDQHFKVGTLAGDVPLGVLLNDQVDAGEPDVVPKGIAFFGLYPESLPGIAAAAIAVDASLVIDLATPGRVRTLPTASGTYLIIGRSRFAVAAAGDPVSIIHIVPRAIVVT